MKQSIKILSLIFVVFIIVNIAACSSDNKKNGTVQPISTQQVTKEKSTSIEKHSTSDATTTVNQTQEELCAFCREAPTMSESIYCANCKCRACKLCIKQEGYLYCGNHNCNESGCLEPKCDRSQYCAQHKCIISGCNNKKEYGSEYCYFHSQE